MSFDQYTQVLGESQLSTDEEQVAMIKRVGQKIQWLLKHIMLNKKFLIN